MVFSGLVSGTYDVAEKRKSKTWKRYFRKLLEIIVMQLTMGRDLDTKSEVSGSG